MENIREALFRKLEEQDPDIKHLGTWHTHHCNGLKTLSQADIRGYFRTVNKPAYRPKFFLASLVTRIPADPREAGWIDHFLFVKGSDEYYRASHLVKILDLTTTASNRPQILVRKKSSSIEKAPHRSASTPKQAWYKTPIGRRFLAEDKQFFAVHFGGGVVSRLRGDQITTTGHLGDKTMSVTYPERDGNDTLTVSVRKGRSNVVEISCELKRKQVAYVAALAALQAVPEQLDDPISWTE
jgi:hypothetical protein